MCGTSPCLTMTTLSTTPVTANQSDCLEVQVPFYLFFTIGVASLVENLLVVVAVICNRNLHSPMYCFICSLAAFNTIASLAKTWENLMLVLVDVELLEKEGQSELQMDDVMDSLLLMSFVGSFLSFLTIAVDRYITIFHALRYYNIMTMRRAAAILGTIWTTCGVLAIPMIWYFETHVIKISFVVFFLVSLVLIGFFYIYMFMLARLHMRKIAALGGSGRPTHRRRQLWGSSMRGAMTLTILFGVFVICWAPFFVHLIVMTVCPMNPYCECYRSLFQLHLLLLMSHALIDPAIYAFRSAELRHTFRKLLLCFDWRRSC